MGPYMHLAAVIRQLSHVVHFVLIMICAAIFMGRTNFLQDPLVFQRFMFITFYLLTLLFLQATTDRMYKGGSPILANRWLSISILTSELGEGAFPSNLLSTKPVATAERSIGRRKTLTFHACIYKTLSGPVIPVTNFHNEDKGFMVLAGDVFDVPIRKDIVHHVVQWQLAKWQQMGTNSTKTISEVSGTGRKPWWQGGTDRARHGTLRGPQSKGGAIMHGPKPRSHAFKLNRKVRRLGLKIALTASAAEGKLRVLDNLEVPTHKTKNLVNYVKQMENTKKLLLVDGCPIGEKLKLATQNLHYANVLPSIGLNVYSILLHDTLVVSREAVNKIVERDAHSN